MSAGLMARNLDHASVMRCRTGGVSVAAHQGAQNMDARFRLDAFVANLHFAMRRGDPQTRSFSSCTFFTSTCSKERLQITTNPWRRRVD